ncbi:MAG TPA: hypothetical protein VIQ51_13220 [Chryseosolibacter sp.]
MLDDFRFRVPQDVHLFCRDKARLVCTPCLYIRETGRHKKWCAFKIFKLAEHNLTRQTQLQRSFLSIEKDAGPANLTPEESPEKQVRITVYRQGTPCLMNQHKTHALSVKHSGLEFRQHNSKKKNS